VIIESWQRETDENITDAAMWLLRLRVGSDHGDYNGNHVRVRPNWAYGGNLRHEAERCLRISQLLRGNVAQVRAYGYYDAATYYGIVAGYALIELASCDDSGDTYSAEAIDCNGCLYRVVWPICDQWQRTQRYYQLISPGSYEPYTPLSESEAEEITEIERLGYSPDPDDESCACDWDVPETITRVED
jgi:hypothetical protein